jgi:hypothetical protein
MIARAEAARKSSSPWGEEWQGTTAPRGTRRYTIAREDWRLLGMKTSNLVIGAGVLSKNGDGNRSALGGALVLARGEAMVGPVLTEGRFKPRLNDSRRRAKQKWDCRLAERKARRLALS